MSAVMEKDPYYKMKNFIDKSGYTQGEVADLIDMSRATFSIKINRKYGRDFSLSEAIRIAKALDGTLSDFI